MWVFLTARLRQWLFFAVAIPLFAVLLGALRRLIERRSGPNGLTRLLARGEQLGRRKKRR